MAAMLSPHFLTKKNYLNSVASNNNLCCTVGWRVLNVQTVQHKHRPSLAILVQPYWSSLGFLFFCVRMKK